MDRVLALAAETGAELVLANDPDADRLAAAVPRPARAAATACSPATSWACCSPTTPSSTPGPPAGRCSSSPRSSPRACSSRMARDRGVACRETLTGFKWIADAALRAEAEGFAFVFGYEEALGYTVGALVRDKDGIGAALRLRRGRPLAEGERPDAARPSRRAAVAHGLVPPGAVVGAAARGEGRREDSPGHGRGCAPQPLDRDRREPGRPRPRRGDGRGARAGRARAERPAAGRRPGLRGRGRRAAHGAPERHRAEDQVLPGAGRARQRRRPRSPRPRTARGRGPGPARRPDATAAAWTDAAVGPLGRLPLCGV